ncbi:MAG TPA: nitrate reductase molybdenum cofactor assembly chaperone [Acidobacteria bacterium]|nr:nitrate reductase molybdenum cofactor assembly chaperone [Acidobacteriota bacterium]
MSGAGPDPFAALAVLLGYPAGEPDRLTEAVCVLSAAGGEVARAAARFSEEIEGMGRGELEELYTRTFDLDPAASLDVGWHLYGEAYERGRFLVTVRGLLREHGIAESGELPDHLGHVLPLLARMGADEAGPFAERFVAPALEKMSASLEDTANPYRHVLAAARALVAERFQQPTGEVCHG